VPEQEKERMPGQWIEEEPETQQAAEEATAGGAAAINPAIIIPPVLIAVVMTVMLALVYGVTKEPIAEAKRLDKQKKLEQVMPAFANDPLELEEKLNDSVTLYIGTVEDGVSGYGLTSSVKTGYSGYFSIVFGIAPGDTIERVRILESFETPGLGSKAANPPFIDQFNGKPLDFDFRVTKDGGGVDAITGATITSRAVCAALSQGIEAYEAAGGAQELAPQTPPTTPEGKLEAPPAEGAATEDESELEDKQESEGPLDYPGPGEREEVGDGE